MSLEQTMLNLRVLYPTLEPEDKKRITEVINKIRAVVDENGHDGIIAMALIFCELDSCYKRQ